MIIVNLACVRCGTTGYLGLREDIYEKWRSGPNMLVVPRMCPDCIEAVESGEDDDLYGDEE